MSDAFPQAAAVDSYNDHLKLQNNLDFLSFFPPVEVVAPHPDLFESDIDSNLAAFTDHLQLFTVDSNDAYNFFRSEKHQWQGPLSTISFSTDSCDSVSFYNESITRVTDEENRLFDFTDLDMDFQRVSVGSEYAAVQSTLGMIDGSTDHSAFAPLSPTPPTSPPLTMNVPKVFDKTYTAHRSSYSECGPPRRKLFTTSSDYYPEMVYTPQSHPTVSPSNISSQLPSIAAVSPPPGDGMTDPRKKYKCTACPRAFARAYNLKTHMATHDPNRLKPYVCPQRPCGRSFSRKHDLGRHLISIHRDEAISSSLLPGSKKAIGVEGGARSWCDSCGKGRIGRNTGCPCADVK
jgi:uncharacterized Zn-finger protein